MHLNEQINSSRSDGRPLPQSVLAGINARGAHSAAARSFKDFDVIVGARARSFEKMVLVVDDQNVYRTIFVTLLGKTGIGRGQILEASSLVEAKKHASVYGREIGLIVTDLSFPGEPELGAGEKSGILFIRHIRITLGDAIPILAQSGDEAGLQAARAAGANEVLYKPDISKKFGEFVLELIEPVQ